VKLHCAETTSRYWPANVWTEVTRCAVGAQTAANRNKPPVMDRIAEVLSLWRARAQTRTADRRMLADLSTLDDHILRDIGINWACLHRQASKPFWRA
jgi:uncharacterized protein YjiS (DUF1127 family)